MLNAFATKLCACILKDTVIEEKAKEQINIIREQLNYLSFDEKRLETMLKSTKAEKEKLFELLGTVVNKIHKNNPKCSIRDGDFIISPDTTVLTTGDMEYLKFKCPEAFCKTTTKNSLVLIVNDVKYNCEV